MALLASAWGFANCTDNMPTTGLSTTSQGVDLAMGTSNADGSTLTMLSALAHDVHYLSIGIGGRTTLTGLNSNALLDIMTDPAGGTSWGAFIDDLVCGFHPPMASNVRIATWYHFPVFIKSGTSIGARARCAHTAAVTLNIVLRAYGNPSNPDMWWCGQKVESLGINAASSSGTSVTPGNATYGSWTPIGTSTGHYGAVQFGVNGSDSNALAVGHTWQIGYGSTQLPGSPTWYTSMDGNENMLRSGFCIPIWCNVASGTSWQARGQGHTATENYNVAIYGVY